MSERQYTLAQLAKLLGVECVGDPETQITGLATLTSASCGHLSFLANHNYLPALRKTRASAVIVDSAHVKDCPCHSLLSDNPYLTYAKASQLFAYAEEGDATIHPTAVISDSAQIGRNAAIGPHCYIGKHVCIGNHARIGAGCVIGDYSVIGDDCTLYANVSIYHRIVIGNRVTVHSAAVIGSDGFGFAPGDQGWTKIEQLGAVRIGNRVEIGAGTTIDRGALDDTIIGDNVIIDNQVVIAHNVQIGDHTAIAGAVGIAGSTKIGKRCTIAGGVGIIGHLTIVDDVHITVCTTVSKSITTSGSYSSGTGMQETGSWRKNAVRFSKLDAMHRRITELEKKIK